MPRACLRNAAVGFDRKSGFSIIACMTPPSDHPISRVSRAGVVPMRELERTNFKGIEKFRGAYSGLGSPGGSSRLGHAVTATRENHVDDVDRGRFDLPAGLGCRCRRSGRSRTILRRQFVRDGRMPQRQDRAMGQADDFSLCAGVDGRRAAAARATARRSVYALPSRCQLPVWMARAPSPGSMPATARVI